MPWTPKRAGETEIFTVDFVNLLGAGETIVSALWSNSVIRGTDPLPSAMIQGAATITGTKVSQKITAGVLSNLYSPVCTATTSLGQVLILPESGNGLLHVSP